MAYLQRVGVGVGVGVGVEVGVGIGVGVGVSRKSSAYGSEVRVRVRVGVRVRVRVRAYGSEVPPLSAALRPDADCTQMRSTPNSSAERVAAPGGARTTFFAAGIAAGVTDRIDASADAMGAAAFGLAPLSSMRLSLAISAVSAWLGLGVRVRVRVRVRGWG